MKRFTAKPFFRPRSEELRFLPEGPRALRCAPGKLGWVSIQHGPRLATGTLNVLDLETLSNEEHPLPGRPGFFAETTSPGVVLIGLERDLVLYHLSSRQIEPLAAITADTRCVVNEGLAVPGGVVFGTKNLTFDAPIAEMYHFDAASRSVRTIARQQTCSNGKHLFERDGALYLADIDSFAQSIVRYRVDAADWSLTRDGVIADFTTLGAFPDGMRPSPDGRSLIVAFYDPRPSAAGYARQYDLETGEPLAEWAVPGSPRVTCPEFVTVGGEAMLLLTTADEGMPEEVRRVAPEAGTLFLAATGFDVLPPPPPLVAINTLISI